MRVIAGSSKGRKLQPPSDDSLRPTTDRVKEALFSAIQFEVEGATVLDLFAGSGQLGIEALSRGAKHAVFVDKSKVSLALTRHNLTACRLQGELIQADSLDYLKQCKTHFDLVFLDPPYGIGLLQEALPLVSGRMRENGTIVAECPYGEEVPERLPGGFVLAKSKKYGTMALKFYKKG